MIKPDRSVFRLLKTLCGLQRGVVRADDHTCGWVAEQVKYAGPELARQAIQHKVPHLAMDALRTYSSCVPETVTVPLKKRVATDMAVRMLLLREWRPVIEAVTAAGFRCLTLKGPASSIQFYDEAGARGYNDLDLLIDVEDYRALSPVMMRAGYLVDTDGLPAAVPRALRYCYADLHQHAVFRHRALPVNIEVHNHAWKGHDDFFPVSTATLFERSVTVEHDGYAFRTLDPVDHSLYIITHGISHDWMLLHWILDAAVILSLHNGGVCAEIADRARQLRLERALAATLLFLSHLFGSPVPAVFSEIVESRRKLVLTSVLHCTRSIAAGGLNHAMPRYKFSRVLRHLWVTTESIRVRVFLLLSFFLVTPSDLKSVRLPARLFFLYLPLRPVLVLDRVLRRATGRTREEARL